MDYNMLVGSSTTAGSIASWVNYSPIAIQAPELVIEAESWIYRRLRHWMMLTTPQPGVLTVGQGFIPNPSDMLEPFLLWTTGNYFQFIEQRVPQEVVANQAYDGNGNRIQAQPLMYYQDQANLNFDSVPDQAYAYNLIYYQQPQPLSSTITNFITQTYPRLMRLACMASGCEFAKDAGQGNFDRTYWDELAEEEIERARAESDRARRATVAAAILVGGGVSSNFPSYVTGY